MTFFLELHVRDSALSSLHKFLYGKEADDPTDGFAMPPRNLLAQFSVAATGQEFFSVSIFSPIGVDSSAYFGVTKIWPVILFATAMMLFEQTITVFSFLQSVSVLYKLTSFLIGAICFCFFGNICSLVFDIYYEKPLRYRSITSEPISQAIYDYEFHIQKSDFHEFNFRIELWNTQTVQTSLFFHRRAQDYALSIMQQVLRNTINLFTVFALGYFLSDALFDAFFSAGTTVPVSLAMLVCFGAIDLLTPNRNVSESLQRTFLQTIICTAIFSLFLQQADLEENSKNLIFLMRWFLWCSICRASLFFQLRQQY